MLFNGTLISGAFFSMLTLTLALNQFSSTNPSAFTLDQFIFNDTSIYRTLEQNYHQDLSPFDENDTYLTEMGEFTTNNINGGQLTKRLVVTGHDLTHVNQPNFYDAILVQSVPGSELSLTDTTHGRLTVAFQREMNVGEVPIQIARLKIKFSILPNSQSKRISSWFIHDQTSESYDAWLQFYAHGNDTFPNEVYGFYGGDTYAEFTFPQNAPIGFVFSAFNGSFVVVNDITIEF
jgi:hypothetical protein